MLIEISEKCWASGVRKNITLGTCTCNVCIIEIRNWLTERSQRTLLIQWNLQVKDTLGPTILSLVLGSWNILHIRHIGNVPLSGGTSLRFYCNTIHRTFGLGVDKQYIDYIHLLWWYSFSISVIFTLTAIFHTSLNPNINNKVVVVVVV